MSEVTNILNAVEAGDPRAADELLPLVYDELRRLAQRKIVREAPGQTLDATSLVHEAYLRLVSSADGDQSAWANRRHFFAAAAEAMRRILVDSARRKRAAKHGGRLARRQIDPSSLAQEEAADDVEDVVEAVDKLAAVDPLSAGLVKLHYFAGVTIKDAAQMLNIAPRTADSYLAYARAWLFAELKKK